MADQPSPAPTADAAPADAAPANARPEQPPADDAARKSRRKKLLTILAVVVVALGVAWGVWHWLTQAGRVSTDNAYVGADTAQVTPLISAPVREVRVVNTQAVKRGDVLVLLDDSDQRIALAQAQAALAQAEQRFRQAQGNVGAAQGVLEARASDIGQANARLRQADAELAQARTELRRREALIGAGAVSGEELTSARTAFQNAQAARDLAQAALRGAQGTRSSATGQLEASEALVRGTTLATAPDVVAARARVDQARLDLDRAVIRAPIDGVVTNRQVQIGQRIAAGTPIMTLVPVAAAYVDANFKETQLAKVRVGQPATLKSDFYGGDIVYHGRVIGFSGGTGSAFSLIPAQNATGNWIKVVQRLPVRIQLDPRELRDHPLRVGLSMDVTIDTRGR